MMKFNKTIALLAFALLMMCSSTLQAQDDRADKYLRENLSSWTKEQKLYALSKFWMEAKYNFIYMDRIGHERWDSLYKVLIPQVEATRNDMDFTILMKRFCAFLKDGHTQLWFAKPCKFTTTYFSDGWVLRLKMVDGKVIVSSIVDTKATTVPLYSEVIELDGKPIAEALDKKVEECFGSTMPVRIHEAAASLLSGTLYTPHAVTFRTPKGKIVNVTLYNEYRKEYKDMVMKNAAEITDKAFQLDWYPGDVAYVRIGTFMMGRGVEEGLDRALPEMQKRAKKLIIDLRQNSGGNSGFAGDILSMFVPDSIFSDCKWRTRTYNAAYASWGMNVQPKDTIGNKEYADYYNNSENIAKTPFSLDVIRNNAKLPHLILPTLILTDYATNSSCENFLVAASGQNHIKRMGETSSGSTGNPLKINIIHGLQGQICTKEDVFPDGRIFVGVGIKPDYEVHQTLHDYMNQYDTILAAALKHFGSKYKKIE